MAGDDVENRRKWKQRSCCGDPDRKSLKNGYYKNHTWKHSPTPLPTLTHLVGRRDEHVLLPVTHVGPPVLLLVLREEGTVDCVGELRLPLQGLLPLGEALLEPLPLCVVIQGTGLL